MKRIKYLLLFIACFVFIGVVRAENITIDALTEELKTEGYTVNNTDGKLVVSKDGKSNEYAIDESANTISYVDSDSSTATAAISNSTILKTIVKLSSNYANYDALKSSKNIQVDYGTGCDLTNMGVCFDAESKKMEISLSNTFTTYLVSQYSGGSLPGDSSASVVDPSQQESTYAEGSQPTETVQPTEGDAKNPTTGSFAEYSVIFGLAALLLVVIILKKRNETEYDL